jgi:pyruvyltransferase
MTNEGLTMHVANAYYWKDVPNFGDRMAHELLRHFTNSKIEWSEIQFADVLATGSIIEQIPAGWNGIVAGPGLLVGKDRVDLSAANVLAVRGPLTLERIKHNNKKVVLGDPGLLADELVHVHTRDRLLGILPHWTDTRLRNDGRFQFADPLFISPFDDPLTVIEKVGRCQKIVTSSLHGMILADAFGIPRRFEMSPRMLPEEGGTFKYRDYAASIGVPFKVGETQQANRNKVEDLKHELFDVFREVRRILPWGSLSS